MKRLLSCLLVLLMVVLPLSACKKKSKDEIYSTYEIIEGEDGDSTASGDKTTSGSKSTKGGKKHVKNSEELLKTKLDLGGKTFVMAITEEGQYHTTSFNAMIKAFQSKYNCKISTKKLEFNAFNEQVQKKMSTGTNYDIIYLHGSMFPSANIMGNLAKLDTAMTMVDTSAIDKNKTAQFNYNGTTYGAVPPNGCFPWIFYYNKVLFNENFENEDPRTLYNNGQWTWDKVFEMGNKVTNVNEKVYFLSSYYVQTQMYGTPTLGWANGKPVVNVKAEGTKKALTLLQAIYNGRAGFGNGKPIGEKDNTGSDHTKSFMGGRNYMYCEESSKYTDLLPKAKKSVAFNKKGDNLAIVPVPLPAENTAKAYPTGWYTAICAGEGTDPRVALTWANFVSSYKNDVVNKNEFNAEDKALINKLLAGNTLPNRQGAYVSKGGVRSLSLHESMVAEARNGGDIAQIVDKYYPQYIATLDDTVGKGNYTIGS